MITVGTYGFNHRTDVSSFLLKDAEQCNISITRSREILISRLRWSKGAVSLKNQTTHYKTFLKALRALRHTIDSIQRKMESLREMLGRFLAFHDWLASKELQMVQKKEKALEDVYDFLLELTGVRCQNLFEVKELLGGEDLPTANLEELLEDGRWGAARALFPKICRYISDEHRRQLNLMKLLPKQERALGKLWEYYLWQITTLINQAEVFGAEFDRAKDAGTVSEAARQCQILINLFGDPLFEDLIKAKAAFQEIMLNLNKSGRTTSSLLFPLRAGLGLLRDHETWLFCEETDDSENKLRDTIKITRITGAVP